MNVSILHLTTQHIPHNQMFNTQQGEGHGVFQNDIGRPLT